MTSLKPKIDLSPKQRELSTIAGKTSVSRLRTNAEIKDLLDTDKNIDFEFFRNLSLKDLQVWKKKNLNNFLFYATYYDQVKRILQVREKGSQKITLENYYEIIKRLPIKKLKEFLIQYAIEDNERNRLTNGLYDYIIPATDRGYQIRKEKFQHLQSVWKYIGKNKVLKQKLISQQSFSKDLFNEDIEFIRDPSDKLLRQYTAFFSSIFQNEELRHLVYDAIMFDLKKHSETIWKNLDEATSSKNFKNLVVGTGPNSSVYANSLLLHNPFLSEQTLFLTQDDWIGGPFNMGGVLMPGFQTNSRLRPVTKKKVGLPTKGGNLNKSGETAILNESDLAASRYATDDIWALLRQ